MTEHRHQQLAADDDGYNPPWQADVAPWSAKRKLMRGAERIPVGRERVGFGRHEDEHRNERGEKKELVREGVEQASEISHQVAGSRELPVVVVGNGGDDVNDKSGEADDG